MIVLGIPINFSEQKKERPGVGEESNSPREIEKDSINNLRLGEGVHCSLAVQLDGFGPINLDIRHFGFVK